jgi:ferredoxin
VQVLVDLNRCQSYGQCVYAAPDVFRLAHEEVLEWHYAVDDERRGEVERAAHACPVQAIRMSSTRRDVQP